MRNIHFSTGHIYHVFNRGVDKRSVFLDDADYTRFMHDLYEFNDIAPAPSSYYGTSSDVGNRKKDERKLLVDVLAFCLMPNHFHILLRQREEGGITLFMKKMGSGYVNYFNTKHERSGVLFQSRFRAVHIERDAQLFHIPYYIHANPIDLISHHWKENGLNKDMRDVVHFLESYRWSSYGYYIGKEFFPSLIQREFLNDYIGAPQQFKIAMVRWIQDFDPNHTLGISID